MIRFPSSLPRRREDQNYAKAVIGKEAVVTHISQGREMFSHFYGLDSIHGLCVCSVMIME